MMKHTKLNNLKEALGSMPIEYHDLTKKTYFKIPGEL